MTEQRDPLHDALAEALGDESKSGRWDGYEVDRLHFVSETFAALLLAHPAVRAALSAHDAVPGLLHRKAFGRR